MRGQYPPEALHGAVDQRQSRFTQNEFSVGSNPTRAIMKNDVVEQLRSFVNTPGTSSAFLANAVIIEAADMIERLRKELTERIHMCDMRSEKILELTAERDEARREICQLKGTVRWNPHFPFATPQQYAEVRDWDCFKQEK